MSGKSSAWVRRKGQNVVANRSMTGSEQSWDLVITAKRGWFDVDVKGVWRYRDLILLLFKRDFVTFYKQTILGPIWYLIQPAVTTLAFFLVFYRIAKIPTDGIPPFLFYMSGVILWSFFAACMSKTSDTFVSNATIFGKVYFPRLVVPISIVLSNSLTFFIQLALLIVAMLYFWLHGAHFLLGWQLVLVPILLVYVALLGLGVGTIVSSLTTRYRDLTYVVGFATQLWMYATPLVYPLTQVPPRWQWIYACNPMAAAIETFRHVMLGAGTVTTALWTGSIAITVAIGFFGLLLFSRTEKTSMDTV